MNNKKLGIARDRVGWWTRFEQYALELGLEHEVFEIERSDWLDRVRNYAAVLCGPNLDPPYCEEGMEKIYFMEHHLKLRVFPNWSTFWHYDNKKAQSYIFQADGVASPQAFVSYSRAEAMDYIQRARFPLVAKNAGGASSEAVRLLSDKRQARLAIRSVFHEPIAIKVLRRLGIQLRWRPYSQRSYVLWQEFIPDNVRDLRVTIIGRRHAFVFWRNNRPGDFRASGSGLIDYNVADGKKEIEYCWGLCRRYGFDSMAFDIVYREGRPVILEMSYAFNDQAIHDAPGHYVADADGALAYAPGHVWPQELMIRYVADWLAASGGA